MIQENAKNTKGKKAKYKVIQQYDPNYVICTFRYTKKYKKN